MGNCAAPSRRAASWTDDGELVSPELGLEERTGGVEVKINVSRRQLQELLEMAAAAGGGDGVVLASIINAGEVVDHRHRHWKPALQSIPEAVEP
ncbi:hypothetical protein GUJ93_ZPchr0005g14952 [Zizania palustris]|uniref:Uncharacterized protein n=1 Tax=Zizania palustris TaxID=103762 RepID=A0A8J5S3K2_ZIZPA|nr:hypothetical protein GUJ93_ZPchr0005g14952 [Zizania palustris]